MKSLPRPIHSPLQLASKIAFNNHPIVYPKSTPLSLKTSLLAYKLVSIDLFDRNFPPTYWKLNMGIAKLWLFTRVGLH